MANLLRREGCGSCFGNLISDWRSRWASDAVQAEPIQVVKERGGGLGVNFQHDVDGCDSVSIALELSTPEIMVAGAGTGAASDGEAADVYSTTSLGNQIGVILDFFLQIAGEFGRGDILFRQIVVGAEALDCLPVIDGG